MKVAMQGSEVFGAAGTVQNCLTGERFERPPFPAIGDLYAGATAINLVVAELNVNAMSVTGQVEIGGQNRYPIVPDDILIGYWQCPVTGLIQLRATASAAASLFWRIELEAAVVR